MSSAKTKVLLPPSNPVLSSTQLGDSMMAPSSQRRRRLRRIDSDGEGEAEIVDISEVRAAPFPGLTFAASSPIARRYDEDDSDEEDEDDRRYSDSSDAEIVSVLPVERSRDEDDVDDVRDDKLSEEEDNEGQDLDMKTLKQLKAISEGARKKTVKRPRPKLDPPTLLGERGLPALLKEAEKIKFQGRGHEFDDLQKLMFIYESWAHRMLPKFSFTEVMERLEVVGSKREVHNALQGMRAGTWPPTLSAEFVVEDDSDNSGSENERHKPRVAAPDMDGPLNDDEIEELLRMQDATASSTVTLKSVPQSLPVSSEPIPSTSTANLDDAGQKEREESVSERIERNRLAALARLEAKRQSLGSMPFRKAPTSLRNALKPMNTSIDNAGSQ